MHSRLRYLRIAWSVAWGIIAMLLCVLWVRSYSYGDGVCCVDNASQRTVAGSNSGCIYLYFLDESSNGTAPTSGWVYFSASLSSHFTGFRWTSLAGYRGIDVPFWFVVKVASSTAVLPWIPFLRFSLRTLLIATTLVAVVLGLTVWQASP